LSLTQLECAYWALATGFDESFRLQHLNLQKTFNLGIIQLYE